MLQLKLHQIKQNLHQKYKTKIMKASEARQIADNCYKEEVDYYFENIYSTDQALKDVIGSAGEGYYGYHIDFVEKWGFQEHISERAKQLIIEKLTNFFIDLGYNVEYSTGKYEIKSEDSYSTAKKIGTHLKLIISF